MVHKLRPIDVAIQKHLKLAVRKLAAIIVAVLVGEGARTGVDNEVHSLLVDHLEQGFADAEILFNIAESCLLWIQLPMELQQIHEVPVIRLRDLHSNQRLLKTSFLWVLSVKPQVHLIARVLCCRECWPDASVKLWGLR